MTNSSSTHSVKRPSKKCLGIATRPIRTAGLSTTSTLLWSKPRKISFGGIESFTLLSRLTFTSKIHPKRTLLKMMVLNGTMFISLMSLTQIWGSIQSPTRESNSWKSTPFQSSRALWTFAEHFLESLWPEIFISNSMCYKFIFVWRLDQM